MSLRGLLGSSGDSTPQSEPPRPLAKSDLGKACAKVENRLNHGNQLVDHVLKEPWQDWYIGFEGYVCTILRKTRWAAKKKEDGARLVCSSVLCLLCELMY